MPAPAIEPVEDAAFSYAAAAKCLQRSTQSVEERLEVCESLLQRAEELTPAPDALVLQHVVYALTCGKDDFTPYSARYWRLMTTLVKRGSAVPTNVVSITARVLDRAVDEPACITVLDALCCRPGELPADLETLGRLAGGTLRLGLEDLTCALLIGMDDSVRRCGSAKRAFGASQHVLWPLCSSCGVSRVAAEITVRNAIFNHPSDVLNSSAYHDALYKTLGDVANLPKPELVPECVRFLLRACRDAAHGRGANFARPRKRAFEQVFEQPGTTSAGSASGAVDSNSVLPVEYSVPARFLQALLSALMQNLGKVEEHSIDAIASLLDTATKLRIYRPTFDEALTKQHATQRGGKKAGPPPTPVGALLAKLLKHVSERLRTVQAEHISRWANCSRAVVHMAEDAVETSLPDLLGSVLASAQNQANVDNVNASNALANLLVAVIEAYQRTRKIPALLRMLAAHGKDLGGVLPLLALSSVQVALVACMRALPRTQAKDCIVELSKANLQSTTSRQAICYVVALIVEALDLDSLISVLPLVSEIIDNANEGELDTLEVLHLHTSIGVACARYSLSITDDVVSTFNFGDVESRIQESISKQRDFAMVVGSLKFLAAWLLLQMSERDDDVVRKAKQTGRGYLKCFSLLESRKHKLKVKDVQWARLMSGMENDWALIILKTVASVCTVLDTMLDEEIEDNGSVEQGVQVLLKWAVLHAEPEDTLWDGLLETRFAKQYISKVVLNEIVLGDNLERVARMIPKMNRFLLDNCSRCDLLEQVEGIRGKGGIPELSHVVRRIIEGLRKNKLNAEEVKLEELSSELLKRLSEVTKHSTLEKWITEGKVSNLEALDKIWDDLRNELSQVRDIRHTLKLHEPLLNKATVVIVACALYGGGVISDARLHLLSIISGPHGGANVGACRLQPLLMRHGREACCRPVSLNLLQSVAAVTCSLCTANMGLSLPTHLDWTHGTILQATLRAARMSPPAAPDQQSVTLLRTVLQAVAASLWRARHYPHSGPGTRHHVDTPAQRAKAFRAARSRNANAESAACAALWPLTACALAGVGPVNAETAELLVNAIAELLASDFSASDRNQDGRGNHARTRTAMHHAAIQAVVLLSKRPALMLPALRCIRATLRSGCCDQKTARIIARFYQRVTGPPTVSALIDAAVALVDVEDSGVRKAVELGAAALIARLNERGHAEALRACSDGARTVVRALVETYKSDYQFERE